MIMDAFPKARSHALVIARDPALRSIADLRAEHLPLLEHMRQVALDWIAKRKEQVRAVRGPVMHLPCAGLGYSTLVEGMRAESKTLPWAWPCDLLLLWPRLWPPTSRTLDYFPRAGPGDCSLQAGLSRSPIHVPVAPARHISGANGPPAVSKGPKARWAGQRRQGWRAGVDSLRRRGNHLVEPNFSPMLISHAPGFRLAGAQEQEALEHFYNRILQAAGPGSPRA